MEHYILIVITGKTVKQMVFETAKDSFKMRISHRNYVILKRNNNNYILKMSNFYIKKCIYQCYVFFVKKNIIMFSEQRIVVFVNYIFVDIYLFIINHETYRYYICYFLGNPVLHSCKFHKMMTFHAKNMKCENICRDKFSSQKSHLNILMLCISKTTTNYYYYYYKKYRNYNWQLELPVLCI